MVHTILSAYVKRYERDNMFINDTTYFLPVLVFGKNNTPNAGVGVFHQPHCCKPATYDQAILFIGWLIS